MSIVEKAISKRRAQAAANPTTQPLRPSEREVQAPVPGSPVNVPQAVQPVVTARPKAQIKLDLQRLRSINAIAPEYADARITDEFRRIKWPLLRPLLVAEPDASTGTGREIMVTSSVPEEGKTFVTLNLALSIAHEKDCTVLLVDADVAKPKLTRIFEAQDRRGLTDLLVDPSLDLYDVILETSIDGLWFLPAGYSNPLAPELLASHRLKEIMQQIAARDPRRVILFDSPPLLATNEAQALGQHIRNVLMVVRAESTAPALVAEALAGLGEGKQVNCVLNRAPRNLSNSYYGSYYNYGQNKKT
jgi:exopolysaccharide/PEP-CTERM locus tyrosine autokinase